MNKFFCILMMGCSAFSVFAESATEPTSKEIPAPAITPVNKLLFIGNSFTYCNNLPRIISDFFASKQQKIAVIKQHTPGAYSFEMHLRADQCMKKIIPSENWTHWILQDQSFMPVASPSETLEHGGTLCKLAFEKKVTPVLFLTWAYEKHSQKGILDPEMQDALNLSYSRLAIEANALIAPCGPAWAEANRKNPKIILYSGDGQHPAPAGSYLAAAVFYSTLTGKSPIGLPAKAGGVQLPKDTAKFLQEIAWKTVQEFSAKKVVQAWQDKESKEPTADFLRKNLKKGMSFEEVVSICGEPSQRNDVNKVYVFEVQGDLNIMASFKDNQLASATLSGANARFENLIK